MWKNVYGHDQVKEFLASYLQREERPHALLFSGAEGLGKRKLALEFARSLLCFQHSEGDGCEACRLMNLADGNLSHPDFLHITREEDPKTHRFKDLSIDQIRDLNSKASFAPVLSKNKVCLIEDIDHMSEAAANSFLKLLEEPSSGWVFILTATSTDRLLSTILSRVVHLHFYAIPDELVQKALADYENADAKLPNEERKIPQKQIPVLARLSEGSLGLALQYHERKIFTYREQAYGFLEAVPVNSIINYLQGRVWLEKYERPEALLFVQLLQLLLRDILMCRLGNTKDLYNIDLEHELQELSSRWQIKSLKQALEVVGQTYVALVTNVSIKLALEAMALKIEKLSKE